MNCGFQFLIFISLESRRLSRRINGKCRPQDSDHTRFVVGGKQEKKMEEELSVGLQNELQ